MPKQRKQSFSLWCVTAQSLFLRINIVTQAPNTRYDTKQKSGMNYDPALLILLVVLCPLSFVICK